MGYQYPFRFLSITCTHRFEITMDSKLLLVATLACLYVVPAYATVDLVFGANAIGIGTAAGITGTTTTIGGGAVLLGALGATIGKALLLRELTRGRGGSRRVSSRRSHYRRGKREALPVISDEEAVRFITDLLQEYQVAYTR